MTTSNLVVWLAQQAKDEKAAGLVKETKETYAFLSSLSDWKYALYLSSTS
jgi:hypothetical protein